MITAVIIDDEKAGVKNLRFLLAKYCQQVNILADAGSAGEGKEIIDAHKPQLVFLDIEMPYGNGFDLLQQFKIPPFEVIFVTAFEKYAIKAIRASACDYILKPIQVNELIAAVAHARERIALRQENLPVQNLLANLKGQDAERKIALPGNQGTLFIRISEIIHCGADGGYTWFYFATRDKLLVTKNLGEYEEMLSEDGFLRVHHAHLVNGQHITEFKKVSAPVLVMSDNSEIPVSHRRRDVVNKFLSER